MFLPVHEGKRGIQKAVEKELLTEWLWRDIWQCKHERELQEAKRRGYSRYTDTSGVNTDKVAERLMENGEEWNNKFQGRKAFVSEKRKVGYLRNEDSLVAM